MDTLPTRRDYSTHTTEALARLAHNRGHGSYGADSELAMIVAELARRLVRIETALAKAQMYCPVAVQDECRAALTREMA